MRAYLECHADAVEDKFVDPYDHQLWAGLLQVRGSPCATRI
jgi:hypothetical protein